MRNDRSNMVKVIPVLVVKCNPRLLHEHSIGPFSRFTAPVSTQLDKNLVTPPTSCFAQVRPLTLLYIGLVICVVHGGLLLPRKRYSAVILKSLAIGLYKSNRDFL